MGRFPVAKVGTKASTGGAIPLGVGASNPEPKKNAGLKAVTLIATLNPVSQVLW